jgi:hypothetical protein
VVRLVIGQSAFVRSGIAGVVTLAVAWVVVLLVTPDPVPDADEASVTVADGKRYGPMLPEPVAGGGTVIAPPDAGGGPVAGPELPLGAVPGIPAVMVDAYRAAARGRSGCGLDWTLLAGIGKVESDHARAGAVTASGLTATPIRGRVLDGSGSIAIPDTDGGALDGDSRWDRAVGPMQFLPRTWSAYAVDGDGDGATTPDDVYDATATAANYLCAGGADLTSADGGVAALRRYNRSAVYGELVLRWADAYARGIAVLPATPAQVVAAAGPLPPAGTGSDPARDGDREWAVVVEADPAAPAGQRAAGQAVEALDPAPIGTTATPAAPTPAPAATPTPTPALTAPTATTSPTSAPAVVVTTTAPPPTTPPPTTPPPTTRPAPTTASCTPPSPVPPPVGAGTIPPCPPTPRVEPTPRNEAP